MAETKPIHWIASSRADLRRLPEPVREVMGYALYRAQTGAVHPDAKPLKGFGGAGVLEVCADLVGATFRAVYTVRFERAVYVLHVFQKKSKHGIETPRADMALVRDRLRVAEAHYQREYGR